MTIGVVAEEIIDSLLLHQARGEGEIALPILHRIAARDAGLHQPRIVDILHPGIFEHLLDDLDDGLVLIDRHLPVLVEVEGPGADRQAVMMPRLGLLHIFARRDQPVEAAQEFAILQHRQRCGFAEMRLKVDFQRRNDIGQHLERRAQPFRTFDPFQDDLFVAHVDRHLRQALRRVCHQPLPPIAPNRAQALILSASFRGYNGRRARQLQDARKIGTMRTRYFVTVMKQIYLLMRIGQV